MLISDVVMDSCEQNITDPVTYTHMVHVVCSHLCPARARRWPGCHWWWCSSSAGHGTGADTPESRSWRPPPRWAWSPRSSGRTAAAWAQGRGWSRTGWAGCPARSTGGQLQETCSRGADTCVRCCNQSDRLPLPAAVWPVRSDLIRKPTLELKSWGWLEDESPWWA